MIYSSLLLKERKILFNGIIENAIMDKKQTNNPEMGI